MNLILYRSDFSLIGRPSSIFNIEWHLISRYGTRECWGDYCERKNGQHFYVSNKTPHHVMLFPARHSFLMNSKTKWMPQESWDQLATIHSNYNKFDPDDGI